MSQNPEDPVVDAIDRLVDEQLGQEASGYDHNVNQQKCPHCGANWHGLAWGGCPGSLVAKKDFAPLCSIPTDDEVRKQIRESMAFSDEELADYQSFVADLPDKERAEFAEEVRKDMDDTLEFACTLPFLAFKRDVMQQLLEEMIASLGLAPRGYDMGGR